MRMAHQRHVRGVRRADVEKGFQAAYRTGKHDGFDLTCQTHMVPNRMESGAAGHPFMLNDVDPHAIFALTRELIDIESITRNEGAVGEFLLTRLGALGFVVEKMPVEPGRFN